MRLPRRYVVGMVLALGLPVFALVMFLVLTPVLVIELGLVGGAIGVALVALIIVYIAYVWTTRSYISIYADRVVINGRTFRPIDVLWVDIYEAEEDSSFVRVGDDTTWNTETVSEMVFTVAGPSTEEELMVREVCSGLEAQGLAMQMKRYLPRLQISRHEGVEDRTLIGTADMVVDKLLGR
jgi:hypothetical protein